jgi:hypothetical protein
MTLPILDRDTDGKAIVPFNLSTMVRNSGAYSSDTGESYYLNRPRIISNRIPIFKYKPRIYHSFPEAEVEMKYDVPAGSEETYLTRAARFESEFPLWTKILLGSSALGKPIYAYRLGAASKPHLVCTNIIHGNEHDGINGVFKAMEILGSYPEFGPTRDEFTLFFVPVCNPDGYKNNLRNLATIGPNGRTVNLNRNWNWFWLEYSETASESKGSAAESEVESQALLDYWRGTGPFVAQGPTTWACLLDNHANRGEEVRYQSRDRIWREIPNGPSDNDPAVGIPNSYLTQSFDYYVWKLHAAFQTERVYAEEWPFELHVSYRRSRMYPHFHNYFSSQGVPSMITEEIKVADALGRETYKTACDFRLDYCLAWAAVCTKANWEYTDACLIEKGGTNLMTNSEWDDWYVSSGVYRPRYWSTTRGESDQSTDTAIDDNGTSVEMNTSTAAVLPQGEEFLSACAYDEGGVCGILPSSGTVFDIPFPIYRAAESKTLARTGNFGAALVRAGAASVDILGGGTSYETGAVNTATRLTNLGDPSSVVPTEAAAGNIGTTRMHAGYSDNFLDYPSATNERGYLVGGVDNGGAKLNSLGTWNPTTTTFTPSAQTLAAAVTGPCAVYAPSTGDVFIFGGDAAGGVVDTIQKWDPVGDTLSTLAAVIPTAVAHLCAVYDLNSGKIIGLGGRKDDNTFISTMWEFDPVAETVTTLAYEANLSDTEDNQDGEVALWDQAIAHNAAAQYVDETQSTGVPLFIGGRLLTSAGSLTTNIYSADTAQDAISLMEMGSYAYIRYNTTLMDTEYTVEFTDDFTGTLAGWTDPNTAWEISGNECRGKTAATTGPLILATPPTNKQHELTVDVKVSTADAPDFSFALRGTYAADVLTDGYRVRYSYNAGTETWYLERRVASATTTLATYDVSADATRQITTSYKTVIFECAETDPVNLVFSIDGNAVFDYYDFDAARIKTNGDCAIEGGMI